MIKGLQCYRGAPRGSLKGPEGFKKAPHLPLNCAFFFFPSPYHSNVVQRWPRNQPSHLTGASRKVTEQPGSRTQTYSPHLCQPLTSVSVPFAPPPQSWSHDTPFTPPSLQLLVVPTYTGWAHPLNAGAPWQAHMAPHGLPEPSLQPARCHPCSLTPSFPHPSSRTPQEWGPVAMSGRPADCSWAPHPSHRQGGVGSGCDLHSTATTPASSPFSSTSSPPVGAESNEKEKKRRGYRNK